MVDLSPHNIQSYIDNTIHVAQIQGSVLLPHCWHGTGYSGKKASPVKTFGTTKARVNSGRNADTPIMGTPRDRRWLSPNEIEWGDLVDSLDIVNFGDDPTSDLVLAGGMALGRAIDEDIIIPAFFGTNYTGENGETATTFPSGNEVAAVFDGQGGATPLGLTATKIARAKRILKGNKERVDLDVLNLAYPADQHEKLAEDIFTTSKDFATKARKDEDDFQGYMGINFIPYEGLVEQSDGDLWLPMWLSRGMHVGEYEEHERDVYKRGDKKNNTQVYFQEFWGATRTQETKVVKIICEPYAL